MKELPDSEGWWWAEHHDRPVKVILDGLSVMVWDEKTERFIYAHRIAKTRWIKIEKPDFSQAE